MLERLLLRPLLTALLKLFFRVDLRGVEHCHAAGRRVLVIANHQSFLDPLLLAVFLPEKPAFAMNATQADKWYFRWVEKIVTIYKLDPSKPLSMKRLIHDLRAQATVVVFPEGRITTSGGIMKIYEGAGLIAEKTGALLLPVRIDGAKYSTFSRLRRKLKRRWFPRITLTFFPAVTLVSDWEKGEAARTIYDIMTNTAFEAADRHRPLLAALLDASAWHGAKRVVASDISRTELNYRQLFTRAFILSAKLDETIAGQSHIGVLLPSSLGALVTFFSLQMMAKIPCMLNFSSGEANLLHACRIAGVKTVLTSRLFVEKGKLEAAIEALQAECRIVYLEDLRGQVTLADKLAGLFKALRPRHHLAPVINRIGADDPAAILYTSGSEGRPKGVALSHANILANIYQARARLDLTPSDILFNSLPVFHSFGLSIGMLLPVMLGIKTFLYPSPLHYRVIPDLIYDTDATVMLGTDTFFNGYARYANSYDFWNIRLAVAGAEKLKESTRCEWADKFRVNILQGYGVTETAPAISFNTPMEHKAGTVGRPFPGMACRLEKVEGLERGGRLLVKGPNVMLGYLNPERPGTIIPQGEWYDTGDIVDIDAQGFITILGRAKRFAKIGGEMVSLAVAEELAASLLPEAGHAALAVHDERKGEQIILFTEAPGLTREQLLEQAKEKGVPEIALPRRIIMIEQLPRLSTGKIDYVKLKDI